MQQTFIDRKQELLEEVCNKIAAGISLRQACEAEGMPSVPTVMRWLAEDAQAAEQYARAIQRRAVTKAEQIEELALKVQSGEIPPDVGRVVIDTHKWIASRLLPKVYGEKQEVSHNVQHTHTLHLEALKTLADEAKQVEQPQVIDLTANPTIPPVLLDGPERAAVVQAAPEVAQTPPASPPPGGRAAAAPTTPHTQKPKNPKPKTGKAAQPPSPSTGPKQKGLRPKIKKEEAP